MMKKSGGARGSISVGNGFSSHWLGKYGSGTSDGQENTFIVMTGVEGGPSHYRQNAIFRRSFCSRLVRTKIQLLVNRWKIKLGPGWQRPNLTIRCSGGKKNEKKRETGNLDTSATIGCFARKGGIAEGMLHIFLRRKSTQTLHLK